MPARITPDQVEKLKIVGSYLREQRELRSQTLEQVAAATFVRPRQIEALETADIDGLPELIYIQGFIRRYGDFLGLDGNELAHRIPRTPLVNPEDLTPEMVAIPVNTEGKDSLSAIPRDRTSKIPQRKLRSQTPLSLAESDQKPSLLAKISPYLLYALILLGAIAGLYTVFTRPQPQPTPSSASAIGETNVKSPTIPTKPANSPKQPVPSPLSATSPTAKVEAKVELIDDAWLKVEADGKKVYEGVLTKGTAQTWTASKTLKIRSGNAGAVKLSVNQKPAKTQGNLGEVKEIILGNQQE
jgi:hypothetical protein